MFQICNLHEMSTERERRQTLGRGLRLPVNQDGLRVRDDSINKLYVFANETYEEFARGLQSEYEQECGVTFGKIPLTALAKLTQVVDGEERPLGRETAEVLRAALVAQNMLDNEGRIQAAFDPRRRDFSLNLPEAFGPLTPAVIDLLSSYQIERHIRREEQEGHNKLRKDVQLSPEFTALWEKIKPRTTYRVEFKTDELVHRAVETLQRMERIEAPKIRISAGQMAVSKGGITATALSVAEEKVEYHTLPIPDLLAYLQNETELTRATLVRILRESGRLAEFFVDPQRFMDRVAAILKYELHRLLVDGIKYERIPGTSSNAEWEMLLFKNEEIINYLNAQQVSKSVYEYIVYDSDVEREFARKLDEREDIRMFVKLPGWFLIDTPVGKYNPDWAILKHDDEILYLVRETKGTRDFLQLRNSEADKVRCGKKHFEEIGVSFDVITSAGEV